MMLPRRNKVYLAVGTTDMRKSINGLSQLVAEIFGANIFEGNLFAFCNKRRDIIKILFWDRNGFCIWHKRLEKDHFLWPKSEQDVINIDSRQMSWLLAGLDINTAHKQLSYREI
ncbi:IS66 family insertion sequence element accessory protein TnpB [Desulfobacterota bacterium M19]